MQRYFFDFVTCSSVEYDYRGSDFDRPDNAKQFAELLALDVGNSRNEEDARRRAVQVRDVAGIELFSVAIRHQAELVAT